MPEATPINAPYPSINTKELCYDETPVAMPSVVGWRKQAACMNYLDDDEAIWCSDQGKNSVEARRICWEECPVRKECLTYAISQRDRYCIWGGYSEDERRIVNRNWKQWGVWPNIERVFVDADEFARIVFESIGTSYAVPADWSEPTEVDLADIENEGF